MHATTRTIEVLGIPLFAKDIDSATETVLGECLDDSRNNLCISATGAHGIVYAYKHKEFRNVLRNFYLNLPDGMPGVWVGRIKGAKGMKRCPGPDFFRSMMIKSRDLDVRHFFCGGNGGVADELKLAVRSKFGNNHIVGTFCPPFLPVEAYDYDSIANEVRLSGADIVWIGLSTPKQELFATQLAKRTNVKFIITVGAAFDFHTNRLAKAPKLLQSIGLEWLFRVAMEPRRLFKRYLEIVPLFLYFNLLEFLNFTPRNR